MTKSYCNWGDDTFSIAKLGEDLYLLTIKDHLGKPVFHIGMCLYTLDQTAKLLSAYVCNEKEWKEDER